MTTPTTTPDTGIPDFLKREPKADAPDPKAAAMTSTAPVAKAEPAPKAKPAKAKSAKPAKAKPEANEDDEEGPHLTKSIVPARFKAKYAATNDTCGTALSLALKDYTTHPSKEQAGRVVLDVEALWRVAKLNHIDVTKYVDLNNGQKRMNVYNRLVGRLNAGENVRIGAQMFKAEDWTPPHAKVKAKPAKARKAEPAPAQAAA